MEAIQETHLPLPLLRRGKVREMYDLGDDLLLVASDRISAFDCVLPQPIPDKGAVLTQISAHWFDRTKSVIGNHCIAADPAEVIALRPELEKTRDLWAGRGMLVRRAIPFPVECVVRGYITGSAWNEYRESGTLAGERLPDGLLESQELESPIFSPATKAEEGHDENITFEQMKQFIGSKVAEHLRDVSLALYSDACLAARQSGIIIADTKFEFGTTPGGEVLLIDEALTQDSSRFWPADQYAPGHTPASLDKQPVRDYLESVIADGKWDRQPPAPDLPGEVVAFTTRRYREAFRTITGSELPDFTPATRGG
ncbi:MAG: phosphoribosylaminoimidazolesuccinocarboxamide synthase [Gemmatimonadales bacterium]|nr:MAG: phosphoribosylaminoimidazolesuccinocarboxamide synthase [Gemmatimonadales bacterium]